MWQTPHWQPLCGCSEWLGIYYCQSHGRPHYKSRVVFCTVLPKTTGTMRASQIFSFWWAVSLCFPHFFLCDLFEFHVTFPPHHSDLRGCPTSREIALQILRTRIPRFLFRSLLSHIANLWLFNDDRPDIQRNWLICTWRVIRLQEISSFR